MRAGTLVLGFCFTLLAMAALADKAVEAARRDETPGGTLRLVWIDREAAAETARAIVLAESARLLAPSGVDVSWTVSDGRQRVAEEGEVHVVVVPAPPRHLRAHVMGAAQPSPHGVRVVWIFASSVRAAIGLPSSVRHVLSPDEADRYGRALARVVLHEVVHVTAPERPHSHGGLMAARLSRSTLEDASMKIDTGLAAIFRLASAARPAQALSTGAVIAMAPMVVD